MSAVTKNAGTHEALPDPRNESIEIYINGEFFPRAEAKVSVYDSAFMIGDGIWEGLRYHDGRFLYLDQHLDRLFRTAAEVGLDLGMDRSGVTAALQATVDHNGMETGAHVRLMVTRGTKKTPSQHPGLVISGPTIVIIAEYKAADPAVKERGVALVTSTVERPSPRSLDQRWNSHSKLHEVVALLQALEAGADEALMLDPTGAVATCNSTNFFIVRNGEVWTSSGEYCLNGITRAAVLQLCETAGIVTREQPFSVDDVHTADEAFVTGTFGGLTPVRSVDGHDLPVPGPVTARLADLYAQAVAEATG